MAEKLYVGTRKGLFVMEREAKSWRTASSTFMGAQVPMLMSASADDLAIVALQHGHFGAKMHRTRDNGRSWQEIAVPVYPEKPADVPDIIDPMRKVAIPWSLELIWALERAANGTLWCGTIPGGLFRSTDDGDSWELVRSLWDRPERAHWFGGGYDYPGIHSICIDPDDPKCLSIAISCGGVWCSEDEGETWECRSQGMRAAYVPPDMAYDPNIQDPHLMVQCSGAPDHFWVQHHNGIFRTTNRCRQWAEVEHVEPSAFGFAVAVHPSDPGTAWFAPAVSDELRYPASGRLVVTRSTDGGRSFEAISEGLPERDSFDLIYRHCLVVDDTGQRLAMGSTTGNLWISEDGGSTWDIMSHHLPPIFCLRWA